MKKEFNLEDYHTGKYNVVTRKGLPVQILKTDMKGNYSVVGVITHNANTEGAGVWTWYGAYLSDGEPSDNDLFLVSKTEKLYVVHFIDYRDKGIKDIERYRVKRYVTKEDAERFIEHCNKDTHYKFIRIEEVEVDEELLKD